MLGLTRRKGAGIDNVGGLLFSFLVRLVERRTGKGHQTGSGGFEDTEGCDELHKGVDTIWLSGTIDQVSHLITISTKSEGDETYTSTMQLLVLMSRTFPPN